MTTDFIWDEEAKWIKAPDGGKVMIGGMISTKTIKHTKTDQIMAFLTVEDLVGTVEVIVWPRDYERNQRYLVEDSKVFIYGRVSVEEEKDGKLVCEKIIPFEEMPKQLWIQFATKDEYMEKENSLMGLLHDSDGHDTVVIYIRDTKAKKELPRNLNVSADTELLRKLGAVFGEANIKVV